MLCIHLQASGVPRVEKIQKAIEIVRLLSENGKLKDRRGIALIEEIFELLPLDECELIFEYLEKRSSWLQKLGAELPPTVRGTGIHKLAPPIADSVSLSPTEPISSAAKFPVTSIKRNRCRYPWESVVHGRIAGLHVQHLDFQLQWSR
jgi:hypothetical protein